jgi:hypothetical protein
MSDTARTCLVPDSNVQILEDPSGRLGIQDVTKPSYARKLRHNFSRDAGVDYRIHTFWLRYELSNGVDNEAGIYLTNSNDADRSDFYLANDSAGWTHLVTGFIYPWNKREGFKEMNNIPIVIKPH